MGLAASRSTWRPAPFPAGAVLKFGAVSETEFPFHLDDAQRQLFQYSGGVRLDFGGTVPTRYVNVSVPTIGGETSTDRMAGHAGRRRRQDRAAFRRSTRRT